MRMLVIAAGLGCAALLGPATPLSATDWSRPVQFAASPQAGGDQAKEREKSPEEKMRARFPQPVKVGDLVGLPVLDGYDSTLGYVQQVVRTPEGKIVLVVPYGKWFGWARTGWLGSRRLVAVPIERVAILARQIAAIDMEREEFDSAPTWSPAGQPIAAGEIIQIAIYNR
jgi:hypothetical protein